jgi:phosphoribosylformylglycinamidine synthase
MGDMCRKLGISVVGGNVSLYNESDETGTQILPTPCIGMIGRAPVTVPREVCKGDSIYLCSIKSSSPDRDEEITEDANAAGMGGSVLDALTACHGAPPACADPQILPIIQKAARAGMTIIDISQGGLLAALCALTNNATITVDSPCDPVSFLFNETYGRFLVCGADKAGIEAQFQACALTELGQVQGTGITIVCNGEEIMLTPDELRAAFDSLTTLMRPA